ncbi:S8 family peptidase [Pasteurella atlantica]|uniref:S8 family peptidase n=1 Tax=Pasteurellaceae TaxID=712 RepID=UPI002763ACB5|nr:S8 family peptidase [Pasteurella atlantica]MDP8033694.1 S8 family peptidase [Pasteurella atlantica]MDP8035526.1 S8 family peptidase [Pasteurella atlantica]MDP8037477.1 S8 family peptidase [Pasteurella atlantica]MDP8047826.1 S8 family peptidase [Pasteurella atlantica]MDP8049781.1 S8 family peptidase [Pasteurella atlantica]
MNNVLELKGKRFIQEPKSINGSGISMNSKVNVTSEKIIQLKNKLIKIKEFWEKEQRVFDGILISVYYNKIVAKSNRILGLFKGKKSQFSIVGAKFNQEKTKHIITYFLDLDDLNRSIELLLKVKDILNHQFSEGINKKIFEDDHKINQILFDNFDISKSKFKQVIADVSYIDNFNIEMVTGDVQQSIITLFDTNVEVKVLLKSIGIDILSSRILDDNTVFLDKEEVALLSKKMPYLISMSTVDLSKLSPKNFQIEQENSNFYIPSPNIEPTIGVIDTLFDCKVYFNEWVEYYDMVSKDIPKQPQDYNHGTAVSSLIVDGARLNPWLDDGCGRFKVRHFGVAVASSFSSFTIIKQIKEIIASNKDIKVWNISLGSNQEINDNFISAEAAVLDQIQYENDVIFVVAGTNKPNNSIVKIGSPADSINSIVVNAVTKDGISTEYTRQGLALSFFAKPDVSYYGGSKEKFIKVCEPLGEANVAGTSFAAPWIARKLSYLIDILGLNRTIAKAMIIDSARGWEGKRTPQEIAVYGHGIVPIHIKEIIHTKDDEIRFLVSDISEKWNTYNYYFPIPLKDDKYPYIARATMCYFPKCERSQGVDYTNTELNLHFGRIQDNGKLKEINDDKQNKEDDYVFEITARKMFRKWDNVKYIVERENKRKQSKKSYTNKNWGMEIKTNNRLDQKDSMDLRFGVVVTLKEINGVNRIDEFIKNCVLNGWLVNELDIQTRIDINQKVNEYIEFE